MDVLTPTRLRVLLIGAALCAGCGDNTNTQPKPDAKPGPATASDSKQGDPDPHVPDVGGGAAQEGPEDDGQLDGDDWGEGGVAPDDSADGGEVLPADGGDVEPPEADAGNAPHPGPCKITWSTGAVLSFKYEDGGGKVRVDQDGDGKVDTCASFTMADGKTTKLSIDDGCKGKATTEIVPTYDGKANVATASFTEAKDGGSTSRDITLVTMPSFTGLTPGYPIYAERMAAKVYVRGGLARTAQAKAPWQGEPLKATFGYDKKKRLVRVKEDFGADGSQDRRFDYRYDDAGNVTGMSVVIGSGQAQQKGYARISYKCFEE